MLLRAREVKETLATIRDVAKRAGVSIATVSAVMTGKKYVSPELTQRVVAACRELDYRPNALAKALYQGRSHMIAFLVPSISNPGFSKALESIEDVARERGYSTFIANTKGSLDLADSHCEKLIEMRVDGVIITLTWELARSELVNQLRRHDIEVVGLASARVLPEIDCFLGDEVSAGATLGRYLASLGHMRCACIIPEGSAIGQRRLEGLQQSYEEAGHPLPPELIVYAPSYDEEGAATATEELLSRGIYFTGLVMFNDLMAAVALQVLKRQGLSVPEDISVATFGDKYAHLTQPTLTTMAYPEAEAGRLATKALVDRIEGKRYGRPETTFVPVPMRLRESTRALGSSSKL